MLLLDTRRPTEPSKRAKVFALRDEGLSLRQIARKAGVSPATAARIRPLSSLPLLLPPFHNVLYLRQTFPSQPSLCFQSPIRPS